MNSPSVVATAGACRVVPIGGLRRPDERPMFTGKTSIGREECAAALEHRKERSHGICAACRHPAEDEPEFAMLLVGDWGVWGYRVLESQHKHFEIRNYRLRLDVTFSGTVGYFPMHLKRIFSENTFSTPSPNMTTCP